MDWRVSRCIGCHVRHISPIYSLDCLKFVNKHRTLYSKRLISRRFFVDWFVKSCFYDWRMFPLQLRRLNRGLKKNNGCQSFIFLLLNFYYFRLFQSRKTDYSVWKIWLFKENVVISLFPKTQCHYSIAKNFRYSLYSSSVSSGNNLTASTRLKVTPIDFRWTEEDLSNFFLFVFISN